MEKYVVYNTYTTHSRQTCLQTHFEHPHEKPVSLRCVLRSSLLCCVHIIMVHTSAPATRMLVVAVAAFDDVAEIPASAFYALFLYAYIHTYMGRST